MKKIYLLLLFASAFQFGFAQLSLTKATTEPVLGDMNNRTGYDSATVIPKNTGTGQLWNFSNLTVNTTTYSTTYTTSASTPSASAFPGTTIASADYNSSHYEYYKSTSTQFEFLGSTDPSITQQFTNSAVFAVWPISMGYSNTDAFSGTASSGTMSGTANGTITVNATGTGTLQLPMGNYTNVLQVTQHITDNVSLMGGFVTATVNIMQMDYYHSSQKFPLLTVEYQDVSGAFTSNQVDISINNNILMGINELTLNGTASLYPNPATDKLNIVLSNGNTDMVTVEILNQLGQSVKIIEFGNTSNINSTINLDGFAKGIYFVKTSVGNNVSTKKLIVQ